MTTDIRKHLWRRLERLRSETRAEGAIRQALRELTPQSRARVEQRGLTETKPVIRRGDALAYATQPAITFTVGKEGKLQTSDVRATARHEVAHFSLPGMKKGRYPTVEQTAAQHFALQAAGATGEGLMVPSGVVLRRAERAARLSPERRMVYALKWQAQRDKMAKLRRALNG